MNNVIKGKLLECQELVVQASNNTKAQFANSPTLSKEIMNAVMDALAAPTTMSKQALESERVCTDAWTEPTPLWRPRKEACVTGLSKKPAASLLVSLADKTHNAEAILFDYRVLGDSLWDRFNGGADGTRWYYGALAKVFSDTMPGRLLDRMARAVAGFSG